MKKWEKIEDKMNLFMLQKFKEFKSKLSQKLNDHKKFLINLFVTYYNKALPKINSTKEKLNTIAQKNPKDLITEVKKFTKKVNLENLIKIIKYPPFERIRYI